MTAPLTPTPATSAAASAPAATPSPARSRLTEAAQQFEAIFVRQMLSSARAASFGDTLFGGQAMDTFRTMQDEHFADLAAKSGSFGLATQIEAQLSRFTGSGG